MLTYVMFSIETSTTSILNSLARVCFFSKQTSNMDIITELHDDDQLILLNNTISTSLATSFWWEQQDPVGTEVDHDMAMGEKEKEKEKEDQEEEEEEEELGAMKEMMFKMAAMQPVNIDPTTIHKPKRRNVRISDDPQSVAARRRRERISEKIRILQRLVPGGTKMDTASMLDEAVRYLKFLKRQIKFLQTPPTNHAPTLADHHQLNIINLNTTTTTWPALFFHEPPPSTADDQIIYPPPPPPPPPPPHHHHHP